MSKFDLQEALDRAKAATPVVALVTDSCDCGDMYGCSHGTFPYALRLSTHTVAAAGKACDPTDSFDSHRHNASEISELTMATAEFFTHAREDVLAMEAEVTRLRSALAEAMRGAAEDYRQCIVSARATSDGGHYEKCNGRAEAYRQAATRLGELAGVPLPDWDQIRREVPHDGVYRTAASTVAR
jgi:hypothetical protein